MKYLFLALLFSLAFLTGCSSQKIVSLKSDSLICGSFICTLDDSIVLSPLDVKELKGILEKHNIFKHTNSNALLYKPTDGYRSDEMKGSNVFLLVGRSTEIIVDKEGGKWLAIKAYQVIE